jgi:hypothetical protein
MPTTKEILRSPERPTRAKKAAASSVTPQKKSTPSSRNKEAQEKAIPAKLFDVSSKEEEEPIHEQTFLHEKVTSIGARNPTKPRHLTFQ